MIMVNITEAHCQCSFSTSVTSHTSCLDDLFWSTCQSLHPVLFCLQDGHAKRLVHVAEYTKNDSSTFYCNTQHRCWQLLGSRGLQRASDNPSSCIIRVPITTFHSKQQKGCIYCYSESPNHTSRYTCVRSKYIGTRAGQQPSSCAKHTKHACHWAGQKCSSWSYSTGSSHCIFSSVPSCHERAW